MSGRERLFAPALLLAASVVFFHEQWIGGGALLLRDLFTFFHPWRTYAASTLAAGEIPLWNPYAYTGTPFLANMQSGLLYPLNLPFWLLPFPDAMRWFITLQFALTGWLTYLALRSLPCRPSAAMFGAVGYAFSGWMVAHVEFPNKVAAAGWLPLIVMGVLTWCRGRTWKGLTIGSIGVAACIFAGYPQTTFTVLLGAGVVWAAVVGRLLIGRDRPVAARAAASLPCIVMVGVLVAGVQVVPFLEAWSLSARGPTPNPLALSLAPGHFLDLIYPHIFGLPGYDRYWGGTLLQFWLGHFYVGALTLVLAFLAISRGDGSSPAAGPLFPLGRRGAMMPALWLLGLAAAFCLGDRTPLAPFCMGWVPGFRQLEWISTSSLLIVFPLCWLAALGLDRAISSVERREKPRRPRAGAVLASLLGSLMILGGALALLSPRVFDRIADRGVLSVALPSQVLLARAAPEPVRSDALVAGAVVLIFGGALLAARRRSIPAKALGLLAPVLLFSDLLLAARGINYAGPPAVYSEVPTVAREIAGRADPHVRLYVPEATLRRDVALYGARDPEPFRWAASTMLFNLNLPHRLFSASDGDPLFSARWDAYHRLLAREGNPDARGRLLAAANIGLILKAGPGLTTERLDVPAFLPRARVTAGARRVPAGTALETMLSADWDPWRETIVEDDFPGAPRAPASERIEQIVRSLAWTANTVTLQVDAEAPGYLVLADAAYPGWSASIDGEPVEIFTADHLFRGVDLPAGLHTVRFAYRPASVLWGMAGSGAGLLLLAFVGSAGLSRRWGTSRRLDVP